MARVERMYEEMNSVRCRDLGDVCGLCILSVAGNLDVLYRYRLKSP